MGGFKQRPDLMEQLGRYKTGKPCLYVKRLSDIDMDILEELVAVDIAYYAHDLRHGVRFYR